MTPLIEETWKLVVVGADLVRNSDSNVTADFSTESIYKTEFKELYNKVGNYMEDAQKPLDRHKIAAIVMIATIRASVLKSSEQENKFVGNYVLAEEVGLSYMLGMLNKRLKEKGKEELKEFYFPNALACETSYFRIFYRNLYFANESEDWGLNPLDIAERLFLLEYLTLEKNGIDPEILKEY